jgi:predicted transcriptional regulator containing an HTH domain and an uncharacterized domain shared with the mammalian protein schlafen
MRQLKYPESENIEYKECRGKNGVAMLPEDLWQTIAAFSNTHGGSIFLGVNDNGRVIGLDRQAIDKLQKDSSSLINNKKFNRVPKVDIYCHNDYLELKVAELEVYNKPIYSNKQGIGMIYVRQGATNILASEEAKRSLFAGANGGGENQMVEGDICDLIDEVLVDNYISRTSLKNLTFENIFDKLKKIKAICDSKLNIFGLVAFGKPNAIDDVMHNVYIDFKIFSGTNKVTDDLSSIYNDRKTFHGTLIEQFEQAFNYIKSKLPMEAILNKETGLREDRYILPEEALREALANALAHRDYLIQSSCVNIDLYSDRIELSNPGESLVAISDLEKASSKARNPSIMEFLKVYNITEKTARGIPTIYQAARNRGLLDPEFENISGDFKAILYFSSPHSGKDKKWVDDMTANFRLKDTQKNALVFIKNNGSISNKIYCEINHMNSRNDDRQARRELSELVEKGLLGKDGKASATRYKLV